MYYTARRSGKPAGARSGPGVATHSAASLARHPAEVTCQLLDLDPPRWPAQLSAPSGRHSPIDVAHEPDAPSDAASGLPAENGWTLGVLLRTGQLGALRPLSVTLRAWCTSATSTRSPTPRIAEQEATVAQLADEHARIAKGLAQLEQECAAARHDAKTAAQAAAEVREAYARLENEVGTSRARLAEVWDRVAGVAAQLASGTQVAGRDSRAAEEAYAERAAQWHEDRTRLEASCRGAQERCAELETELARRREEAAELDRVRTAVADAETALQATRDELGGATQQVAVLSKTRDEIEEERSRLAAALARAQAELASGTEAAGRESAAAQKAQVEREAQWREERDALVEACRKAQEHGAELETALARQREEMAAAERGEVTLRAEHAAPKPARDDPEGARAEAELDRVRVSLAEAETALQAARDELTRANDQIASLSISQDQVVTEGRRLAADLSTAEDRVADLERRLEELADTSTSQPRPIPI